LKNKTILVTGGYGFIGSALIRRVLNDTNANIINIDKLTYASNVNSLGEVDSKKYQHHQIDICDFVSLNDVILNTSPDSVIHLAAETHVDRSIDGPDDFISTNICGTYNLLKSCHNYWSAMNGDKKNNFRFIHVSTDEVYGSLGEDDKQFDENHCYSPNSPYSASKASSDHLVSSWNKTYNFPSIITNTCNNYGPWQFPEKLIPLVIEKCLSLNDIPVYGNGMQVRDWIHVDDHVTGILQVLDYGNLGDKYNIGSNNELRNIQVVRDICDILNKINPANIDYNSLIKEVSDRPGHDFRYGINNKRMLELGWLPDYDWKSGLYSTIEWYLQNKSFLSDSHSNSYSGERLGKI
jgi:dTDP-glucose 4,6-dehydratase